MKVPSRRRLDDRTKFFEGDYEDLEQFVPANLTRRQVTSKLASLFDILGKLTPVIVGFKVDLRGMTLLRQVVPQNEVLPDIFP